MARESNARVHNYYSQMHELQPPAPLYHYVQSNSTAVPAYELTAGAGAGGGGCADGGGIIATAHAPQPPLAPVPSTNIHDHPKRNSEFNAEFDMSSCDAAALPAPSASTAANTTRKRKTSSYASSNYDDDGTDDARSTRSSIPDKKQNHSEIEKRRRDKMNTYITELSTMIPMCGAMSRKLDKLTVLRMAVQHLRSVRGALAAYPLTARPRPAFLSEKELNAIILQAAHDSFLLVVGCDRGRLLYVSASVKRMLQYEQSELLGQSLFDILHPKDVGKVKEQLSASDLSPRERLIDIKTMLPVKSDVIAGASRFCPGARRSFFCRIKCKATSESVTEPIPVAVKEEGDIPAKLRKKQSEKKYCVVQCTGYLKSWAESQGTQEGGEDGETCNLSCLVAVGRALPDLVPDPCPEPSTIPTRGLQYVSRHATDGKFLFVDQRVTLVLGFLPQELLGTSMYEYVNGSELGVIAHTHKQSLLRREAMHTPAYSFRCKNGSFARIQTHFKPFRNPWTKDVEYLVANNTVVTNDNNSTLQESGQAYDLLKQSALSVSALPSQISAVSEMDVDMQRLIDSQVESHKIGSAIAEEAFRRSSVEFSPDLPADLLPDTVFNQQSSLMDNILGVDVSTFSHVRNNVPLSSALGDATPPPEETMDVVTTSPPLTSPIPSLGLDGNGEAAMAVIMSLLEADAGLGGPVNFSGLPWPLP